MDIDIFEEVWDTTYKCKYKMVTINNKPLAVKRYKVLGNGYIEFISMEDESIVVPHESITGVAGYSCYP